MGLDATIRITKPILCPHCNEVVYNEQQGDEIATGGHVLRAALDRIGYGEEQYGNYIKLTPDAAKVFAEACEKDDVYNSNEVAQGIAYALFKGYDVWLESDW